MAERTNLAEILSDIFDKFNSAIPPSPNDGTTVLQIWTKIVGGDNQAVLEAVANIGRVCSILARLEQQVCESKRLKHFEKNAALETVREFRPFFQFDRMNVRAVDLRSLCDEIHRGRLCMVGHSLEREFSEPKLEKIDADQIILALEDIVALLDVSDIPLNLKLNLKKYTSSMIWWLRNPDIASVQDIFEMAGAAMIVSRQIKDYSDVHEGPAETKSIFDKALGVCKSLAKIVSMAERGMDATNRIAGEYNHLMENFNPPT